MAHLPRVSPLWPDRTTLSSCWGTKHLPGRAWFIPSPCNGTGERSFLRQDDERGRMPKGPLLVQQLDHFCERFEALWCTRIESGDEVAKAKIAEPGDILRHCRVVAFEGIAARARITGPGDVAAGRADHRRRVAFHLGASRIDRRYLLLCILRVLVPDRVPGIGIARNQPQHSRSARSDQDRRATGRTERTLRSADRVLRLEELAVVVGAP